MSDDGWIAMGHTSDEGLTRTSVLFANDLPYTESQTDPVAALRDLLAFSARDWGEDRDTAWLYGIVLGWDDEPDDEPGSTIAEEFRGKFGWTAEQFARLQALHEAFDRLVLP